MLYDIYLTMGCRALPTVSDLIDAAPSISDPLVQQKMLQRSPRPGFLGLDLPRDLAATLMQRLTSQRAVGYPVPSAYRQPQITQEQALPIATRAIEHRHMTHIPEHTLGPVLLREEKPVCWTFSAASQEWTKAGRIPGALFANVDKLDGHLWGDEDFQQLRGEQ
jgi:hypothetical protein